MRMAKAQDNMFNFCGRELRRYFLDIRNLKNFDDSLGHVFGDRVPMSVTNRLEEIFDGLGFVARLAVTIYDRVRERRLPLERRRS